MPVFPVLPYMLLLDEGQEFQGRGATGRVLADSKQTGGAFNLFEAICPAGFATPLLIHYTEDVAIFVLEGTLTFFCGHEKKSAQVGSYFFQPRGTPHGFRVEGDSPARLLYLTIPAGFDSFVLGQAAPSHDDCGRDAAKHKIEILGQLPE